MPEIVNNQRKVKFDKKNFQKFAERAASEIKEAENKSFTVAFVSDSKMRELNNQFREKDKTTDVLSFPFEADDFLSEPSAVADGLSLVSETLAETAIDNLQPSATADGSDFLGDIIISVEQAARQAEENGLTFEREIKQLILHGVLHLCGYDHETDDGEMNARELELRDKLLI